jgi:TolB-like protein/tetratricopeptide (TPR) repeat protein
MANTDPKRFWAELLRRRVMRVAIFYVAGAWILAQVVDLMLDAFDKSYYMRFVIAGLIIGLPVALVLAWVFDITPGGIERTAPAEEPSRGSTGPAAPERSIAVLPFANLSGDPENEYFSDGLSEEIRNRLARVAGLRVAARTSSFAFKGRHEDVREIGRRLNVATLLEGGVRKQADTVRIDVQLVNAADGYQIWSESFERRLTDIFRLQSEVASAVLAAVKPRGGAAEGALSPGPVARSFDAYNLYLLGRHYFHKRTDASLARAVECFEQAIERDPEYALAYAGLADACTLRSATYYGNVPAAVAISHALPAAERALALAPDLAEAHASLGLIRHNQGDAAAAERSLERALALNPGYTMAHVWLSLVFSTLGRFRDAAARNREAFRLDPLSPIINTNAGFDAARFGDDAEAQTRFAAAMEIDPAFAVPYSGMARLQLMRGKPQEALRWIDQALERAPTRAFYHARKGLILQQLGETEAAVEQLEMACRISPGNAFALDLELALQIVRGDRVELARIAAGESANGYSAMQRGQARLALGEVEAAHALYEEETPDPRRAIVDLLNDEWVWCLPHVVTRAHLRIAAGDERGRGDLERLNAELERIESDGVVNADTLYWAACARAAAGDDERALALLADATGRGWRHRWWARHDWNLQRLVDRPAFRELLSRG